MTLPQQSRVSRKDRTARAPYNFVSLPERVLTVDDSNDYQVYLGNNGVIECELVTLSPTYIRAAMSRQFYDKWNGHKQEMMKDPAARAEYATFFNVNGVPVIPGSSLRGMVRTIVEIVSFSQMQRVNDSTRMSFRAVAAPARDPLKSPYDEVIGKYGKHVRAGWLKKIGDEWFILPALTPHDIGLRTQEPFLKIKETHIPAEAIPELIRLNDSRYRPQYHPISFDAEMRSGARGSNPMIVSIGGPSLGYKNRAVLICSGNMLETGDETSTSPRRKHAIVLSPNLKAKRLKIGMNVVDNYLASLTEFQRSDPFDPDMGCLTSGRPIFYALQNGEVTAFGHSPNFRIPAVRPKSQRSSTPNDFVPVASRLSSDERRAHMLDIASALFGDVVEEGNDLFADQRAGKVFFEDAVYVTNQEKLWYREQPVTPKVLASPNPSTFQHYLVQDKKRGHDPDRLESLAHYATPTPSDTVIRGFKMYWHKGQSVNSADFEETDSVDWSNDTQHTQVKPIDVGVRFRFKVHFVNLSDEELGAMLWVLMLPQNHQHHIGMAKPLGLGSVQIQAKLSLIDRQQRYRSLFNDADKDEDESVHWHLGEMPSDSDESKFISKFKALVVEHNRQNGITCERFDDIPRIVSLLALLRHPGPSTRLTTYMDLDDFSDRRVLPSAEQVSE